MLGAKTSICSKIKESLIIIIAYDFWALDKDSGSKYFVQPMGKHIMHNSTQLEWKRIFSVLEGLTMTDLFSTKEN